MVRERPTVDLDDDAKKYNTQRHGMILLSIRRYRRFKPRTWMKFASEAIGDSKSFWSENLPTGSILTNAAQLTKAAENSQQLSNCRGQWRYGAEELGSLWTNCRIVGGGCMIFFITYRRSEQGRITRYGVTDCIHKTKLLSGSPQPRNLQMVPALWCSEPMCLCHSVREFFDGWGHLVTGLRAAQLTHDWVWRRFMVVQGVVIGSGTEAEAIRFKRLPNLEL